MNTDGQNTTADADKIQIEIYKRMTPDERWQEALRLNASAWALKAAGLRSRHPDWSEKKIRTKSERYSYMRPPDPIMIFDWKTLKEHIISRQLVDAWQKAGGSEFLPET